MKENGIKKLIKLLNESEDGFVSRFISYDGINRVFRLDNGQSFHYTLILSKEYGFIKWLVDNDKIDFDKVMKLGIPCFVQYDKGEIISVHDVDFDRQLIMLLSISNKPISDLISYLK